MRREVPNCFGNHVYLVTDAGLEFPAPKPNYVRFAASEVAEQVVDPRRLAQEQNELTWYRIFAAKHIVKTIRRR